MSDLVVTTALTEIRRLVAGGALADPHEVSLHLRALQRRGLSKLDLVVQLERMRATNDAQEAVEQTEENALLVLELIEGAPGVGLTWDVVERAAAWIPRAIDFSALERGAMHALAPSDLLPSRPAVHEAEVQSRIARIVWGSVAHREYQPIPADVFRAPKKGLTTRPAALLAPDDRFVYEALAEIAASAISDRLPQHVIWPRGRDEPSGYTTFVEAPRNWDSQFVLRTDISSFYESIDHAYLGVLVARNLGLRGAYPIALEAFLDAVMQSSMGLPQGPLGSDILASAYLLDIDSELATRDWPVTRYSDDILIGARSFEEARARVRELETLLRQRGLNLAGDKTRIVRRETYVAQLDPDDEPASFRERVRGEVASWFEAHPEAGSEGIVDELDLPEQLQWDLLYHQTVPWEEALEQVPERLLPPWLYAYEQLYLAEASRLTNGGYYPDEDNPRALGPADLRRCLLFLSGGPHPMELTTSQAVIDWHPTLVREMSRYLSAIAAGRLGEVADFLRVRLSRGHDSDLEKAWLLSPVVDNIELARLMEDDLASVLSSPGGELTRATAFRALDNLGSVTNSVREQLLESLSPALAAEVALSRERAQADVEGRASSLEQ